MANIATFSLGSTSSTPWFSLLGRGRMKVTFPGTWTGTAALSTKRPDGTAASVRDMTGAATAFTVNTGMMEIADAGEYRIDFTRSTGTLTPAVWSDDSAIYFPNADAAGGGKTFENLPTADPHVSGALWNSSGVVTTSAG